MWQKQCNFSSIHVTEARCCCCCCVLRHRYYRFVVFYSVVVEVSTIQNYDDDNIPEIRILLLCYRASACYTCIARYCFTNYVRLSNPCIVSKQMHLSSHVLLRDAIRKHGLCCRLVSVCLSVCLSRWCIVCTRLKDIVKLLSRSVSSSTIMLVFDPPPGADTQFQVEPLQRGCKVHRVGKFCDFRPKSPFI